MLLFLPLKTGKLNCWKYSQPFWTPHNFCLSPFFFIWSVRTEYQNPFSQWFLFQFWKFTCQRSKLKKKIKLNICLNRSSKQTLQNSLRPFVAFFGEYLPCNYWNICLSAVLQRVFSVFTEWWHLYWAPQIICKSEFITNIFS